MYERRNHEPRQARQIASEPRDLEPLDFVSTKQLLATFGRQVLQGRWSIGRMFLTLDSWRNLLALEALLRGWDGLETLVRSAPSTAYQPDVLAWHHELNSAIHRELRLVARREHASKLANSDSHLARQALRFLVNQFQEKNLTLPLSLESRAWWASVALVELQPAGMRSKR